LNPRPVNRKSNALPLSHHTTEENMEVMIRAGNFQLSVFYSLMFLVYLYLIETELAQFL